MKNVPFYIWWSHSDIQMDRIHAILWGLLSKQCGIFPYMLHYICTNIVHFRYQKIEEKWKMTKINNKLICNISVQLTLWIHNEIATCITHSLVYTSESSVHTLWDAAAANILCHHKIWHCLLYNANYCSNDLQKLFCSLSYWWISSMINYHWKAIEEWLGQTACSSGSVCICHCLLCLCVKILWKVRKWDWVSIYQTFPKL